MKKISHYFKIFITVIFVISIQMLLVFILRLLRKNTFDLEYEIKNFDVISSLIGIIISDSIIIFYIYKRGEFIEKYKKMFTKLRNYFRYIE